MPPRATHVRRRWTVLACALLAFAALAALLLGADAPRAQLAEPEKPTGEAGPVLGPVDPSTVLIGAAPEEAPGSVWGYVRLGPEVPTPAPGGERLEVPERSGPTDDAPQLAFARHTDAGGWEIAAAPRDEQNRPWRGFTPTLRSARTTRQGGVLLAGRDERRPSGQRAVVLKRNPTGPFQAVPLPGAPALAGGESLVTDDGGGRVAAAAAGIAGTTRVWMGALGPAVESAVLRHDGPSSPGLWTREPVAVPPGDTSFRIASLAAVSSTEAYLVGAANARSIRLFSRGPGGLSWNEVELPDIPFTDAAAATAEQVDDVAPLEGQAQGLTATADGVWIDLSFRAGPPGDEESYDATVFVRPSAPLADRVTTWCDAPRAGGGGDLCDHRLGIAFSRDQGYRSFAFAGPGFGERVVTNPLDPGAADEATNDGTLLRLVGTQFVRRRTGGADFQPSGAFASAQDGWVQGPLRVDEPAPTRKLRSWPAALRSPLTSVTPEPGKPPAATSSQALAVGSDGAVVRYQPDRGWVREFLLNSTGGVVRSVLRGVAWPEAGRAHAVGDLGALWQWRSDTGLWERDPATPIGFESNMLGVAFSRTDPQRGYMVGKGGEVYRYDKTWTKEALPDGFASTDLTSVAFAGEQALAAAGRSVLFNDAGTWREDPQLRDLLATVVNPRITVVAGLADGGAVAAGRDLVVVRDSASGPWRFSRQPILNLTATAVGAFRAGSEVRAVVAVQPGTEYPFPDPPIEPDPDSPPPLIPPFGLPADGYLLRQTDTGWRDEQRTAFYAASIDRPLKDDPIGALLLDERGAGWAVGGWSGEADVAGRGASGRGGIAQATRQRVQTAALSRYDPDSTPPAPAGEAQAPLELDPSKVSLAVGGHAQCEAPCADLIPQRPGPDRNLAAALEQISGLAQRPGGPSAFLYTGGRVRERPGVGLPQVEADRLAELLAPRPSIASYPAVGAGDAPGGEVGPWSRAFATQQAPVGSPGGGQTHYAFDATSGAGTVRVIVIDNSAGSLARSDPHQVPLEPQEPWLTRELAAARTRGVPSVVMGSRELDSRATPRLNVAEDADRIAALLKAGGASAYVFDRPEEHRQSRIPAGDPDGIPAFGSGGLGYRSSVTNAGSLGLPDALFGDPGFLLLDVDAARRDAATNRAPVRVRLVPLLQGLALQAVDGTLLRRSRPALFQGLGRRPIAGDRWGQAGGDGIPSPAGSDPYVSFPPPLCVVQGCSTRIVPEYTFNSSNPRFGDFVRVDPQSTNPRKPFIGADDRVVSDATSGLLCAFNPGTFTATVSAGGRSVSQQVTVLGGSVDRPCGTRVLNPDETTQVAAPPSAPLAPPPAATPAGSDANPVPPPPPPPADAPIAAPALPVPITPEPRAPERERPEPRRPQPARPVTPLPPFAPPLAGADPNASGRAPSPPPPPATFFANPIPPGGSTVRVFEKEKETEAAPEQSQAASAYEPDTTMVWAPTLAGLLIAAAIGGAAVGRSRRNRRRGPPAFARTRLSQPNDPRYPDRFRP